MSKYDELKPCPFCGGEGCIQRHSFIGYKDTFGIVCLDCGCETRQFFDSKKDVKKMWNMRADDEDAITRAYCQGYDCGSRRTYDELKMEIAEAIREGEWVYMGSGNWECTACGKRITCSESEPPNYCEHCGSRNQKEQNDVV